MRKLPKISTFMTTLHGENITHTTQHVLNFTMAQMAQVLDELKCDSKQYFNPVQVNSIYFTCFSALHVLFLWCFFWLL